MKSLEIASNVRNNIEKAKAQDGDAAKALIKEFCATVNQNRQRNSDGTYRRNDDGSRLPHSKPSGIHTHFDEELLDYFVECFERIGDFVGEAGSEKRTTADIALNLSGFGKRGPKSSTTTREDSLLRGMRVWDAHRESGDSLEAICAGMSGVEAHSAHTFERDYKLFVGLLRSVNGM